MKDRNEIPMENGEKHTVKGYKALWQPVLLIGLLLLGGCQEKENHKPETRQEAETIKSASEDSKGACGSERGYDLPVEDKDRKEAEADCQNAMEKVRETYLNAGCGNASGGAIGRETARQMLEELKELGNPAADLGYGYNMQNYEHMDRFLTSSVNGKEGEVTLFELYPDGGIGRKKFRFDGKHIYVWYTNAAWSSSVTPLISATSYTRIRDWVYTEKGWFSYELPEAPDITDSIMNGNTTIRVKPIKEEYRETAAKYLKPVGYQGNNLFCSNWDENHMEELDYNGIFQYLYPMEYQKNFPSDQYGEGIPGEEFENLLTKYLPVTGEQLKEYAVYDPKEQRYGWVRLGCGNYIPNAFGNSEPEITDMRENEDGTVTLTVDAVCVMTGNDKAMSHELTVRFTEEGGIQYVKNQILGDGLERIPEYQRRFGGNAG
ncbi:hypothetical protein C3B58_06745 [Lactonifactor longoviformis]|uniref:Uncharacterized protein n=1 Tax=Lactonifactor longoviformis DSM 17459 TaxID=1122155 RepID=A0A1M5AT72_9CLOT|nr:DUF6070 family protein [Lactonifactor longoviformis]POP33580.1 hypothetical protein C3B58_06745 [Lactonifactor longoviformis]SHF33430.1 hypothetical protein SAMN02745158_03321 [Lactonifactor longoviformis DSM 17459]